MSSGAGAQWRWPESELRRIGYQVADLIAGYLSGIDGQPAFRPFPAELARALELAAPSDTYRNDHPKMVVQLQQPCAGRSRRRGPHGSRRPASSRETGP